MAHPEPRYPTWYLLQEIQKQRLAKPAGSPVRIMIHIMYEGPGIPKFDEQEKALAELRTSNAIEYRDTTNDDSSILVVGAKEYEIRVLEPVFTEVYNQHRKHFHLSEISTDPHSAFSLPTREKIVKITEFLLEKIELYSLENQPDTKTIEIPKTDAEKIMSLDDMERLLGFLSKTLSFTAHFKGPRDKIRIDLGPDRDIVSLMKLLFSLRDHSSSITDKKHIESLSAENLQTVVQLISIIKNQIELDGFNRLRGVVKIPIKDLELRGLSYGKCASIVKLIARAAGRDNVVVMNEELIPLLEFEGVEKPLGPILYSRDYGSYSNARKLEAKLDQLDRFYNLKKRDFDEYLIVKIAKLELLENAEAIFKRVFEEKSLQLPNPSPALLADHKDASKVLHSIDYFDRKLVLDSRYLLANPDFYSENDNFMEYVFERPNQRISLEEMESNQKIKYKKSFANIVNDLGFKGELRKLFFPGVSKNGVHFRNPITEDILSKVDLDEDQLTAEIGGLKEMKRNRKK